MNKIFLIIYFLLPQFTFSIKFIKKMSFYKKPISFFKNLGTKKDMSDIELNKPSYYEEYDRSCHSDELDESNESDIYEYEELNEHYDSVDIYEHDKYKNLDIKASTKDDKKKLSLLVECILLLYLIIYYIFSQALVLGVSIFTFLNPYAKFNYTVDDE